MTSLHSLDEEGMEGLILLNFNNIALVKRALFLAKPHLSSFNHARTWEDAYATFVPSTTVKPKGVLFRIIAHKGHVDNEKDGK